MGESSLYNRVVSVTSAYLGPAADRFISRQIVDHLKKKPEKLDKKDLIELLNWIKPAMGILTEDQIMVDEYLAKLASLVAGVGSKKELH
jgi:hypothetical protein